MDNSKDKNLHKKNDIQEFTIGSNTDENTLEAVRRAILGLEPMGEEKTVSAEASEAMPKQEKVPAPQPDREPISRRRKISPSDSGIDIDFDDETDVTPKETASPEPEERPEQKQKERKPLFPNKKEREQDQIDEPAKSYTQDTKEIVLDLDALEEETAVEPAKPKRKRKLPTIRLSKRSKRTLLIVIIIAALIAAYFLYVRFHTFTNYSTVEQQDRSDTAAAHFLEYEEGFVKYSNDGISYVTTNNVAYWNQSYEMDNPKVALCEEYVAVADRMGDDIYIMNEEGLQGQVTVNMPILEIDVAAQGTVAVMMEDNGTCYLALYDAAGNELAEGAIHIESGGTPLDLALSNDGKKLCVSILDVTEGVVRSTLNIYNFGAVGQNEVDNLVAAYPYSDTVIQKVAFVDNNTLLAFGDNSVHVFTGAEVPEEDASMEVEDQIQSILFDDSYFGLIFVDSETDNGRILEVYNLKCSQECSVKTDIAYDQAYFLDNHEVCMCNLVQCRIYTPHGHEKLSLDSDDEIYGMYHLSMQRNYLLFGKGETLKVRLKMIDWGYIKDFVVEKLRGMDPDNHQEEAGTVEELSVTEGE